MPLAQLIYSDVDIACWNGIIKYLWLGCLAVEFPGTLAAKSAAFITYDAGPSADPWMNLADMSNKSDNSLLYLTQCEWPSKKLTEVWVLTIMEQTNIISVS